MASPPKYPKRRWKPGQIYYLLGPIIFLAGGIALVYYVYSGFANFNYLLGQTFPVRVLAPGGYDINLEKGGDYSIYYEYESELQGKQYYSSIDDTGFNISLAYKKTGEKIGMEKPFGKQKYTLPGRRGIAIATFEIKEPGIYTFSVSRINGKADDRAVIAIGSGMSGFIGETITMVLTGFTIFVATITLAVIVMIVIYTKRNRGSRLSVDEPKNARHDEPKPIHPK